MGGLLNGDKAPTLTLLYMPRNSLIILEISRSHCRNIVKCVNLHTFGNVLGMCGFAVFASARYENFHFPKSPTKIPMPTRALGNNIYYDRQEPTAQKTKPQQPYYPILCGTIGSGKSRSNEAGFSTQTLNRKGSRPSQTHR